jgi:IclR family pca regulon transcriptional regulator
MRNSFLDKSPYFVKSLAKGLTVLQILADMDGPLTLSEIAHAMGSDKTTTTRFCHTLRELKFIYRDNQKRYHLSPKVLTLGTSVICGLDWLKIARYYLERLFEEVQKTVNLSILEGEEILYLIRLRKEKYLPFDIRIGTKLPVYCTAMGKVLMAMGPPEKTKSIIEALEFRQLTSRTITSRDKFLDEFSKIRSNGYAINDEELTDLARAVAAPILDNQNYAIAAINIAAPTTECSLKEMEENLAPIVKRVAHEISKSLIEIDAPIVMNRFS